MAGQIVWAWVLTIPAAAGVGAAVFLLLRLIRIAELRLGPRMADRPSILDALLGSLRGDEPIREVVVGAHLTAVCSRRCGLASTLGAGRLHGRLKVRDAGRLHLKSARELAEYARSDNPLEVSLGVAALNSLLEVDPRQLAEGNAADMLATAGRDKHVALVGHFPFVERIRGQCATLSVFELEPEEGDYPAEAAPALIPTADIVAITASALLNHTLDGLLALCPRAAPVFLIGPSTPLSTVLFDRGVTLLAGAEVTDEPALLRSVIQGAASPQAEGVRRVTVARRAGGPDA